MSDRPSKKRSRKSSRHNALLHGGYAENDVLPGESRADFEELKNDLQTEFQTTQRSQREIAFDMARLRQRKGRIDRALESAFVELARARRDARRHKKECKKVNYTNAVVRLSEGVALLTDELK